MSWTIRAPSPGCLGGASCRYAPAHECGEDQLLSITNPVRNLRCLVLYLRCLVCGLLICFTVVAPTQLALVICFGVEDFRHYFTIISSSRSKSNLLSSAAARVICCGVSLWCLMFCCVASWRRCVYFVVSWCCCVVSLCRGVVVSWCRCFVSWCRRVVMSLSCRWAAGPPRCGGSAQQQRLLAAGGLKAPLCVQGGAGRDRRGAGRDRERQREREMGQKGQGGAGRGQGGAGRDRERQRGRERVRKRERERERVRERERERWSSACVCKHAVGCTFRSTFGSSASQRLGGGLVQLRLGV